MLEQAGFAAESLEAQPEPLPELQPRKSRFALVAWLFATVASFFWIGAGGAYLWGFLGLTGLLALGPGQIALAAAAVLLPPLFFISIAAAFSFAHRMGRSNEAFQETARQLFAVDETVSRTAGRLGRSVRRELDALNSGLDGAFGRLRSLETALENQIAALDEAGARAGVRGEAVAALLSQERQRLEILSGHLTDTASRAAEIVTNQSAELKTTIDGAEESLRGTARTLSGHFVEVAARATDVMADRSQQMQAAIDIAEGSLKGTAQSLSTHFIDAAARATDVMADRSAQMKATIDGAEQALKTTAQAMSDQFVEAASRASQTLANRSAQLKASIDTAETSLQAMTQTLSERFTGAATGATELVAGRTAQLKATIETAEGTLKMAGQSLDVQAAKFRATAQAAADAPLTAALELDGRVKKIEEVAEATLSRAEFVLARQEKQRAAMSELLAKLKEEGAAFETVLTGQRTSMEAAISAVGEETKRFESVTGDAERHLDVIMANAATRASQLTQAFGREAETLKEASDTVNALLTGLSTALRDAGTGAQALIGQSSAQAKQDAHALVGEAMAQCDKLLRAAGEMGAEAGRIRETLNKTIEDVERHLTRLPTVAQGEAQRVRHMVQTETDQILDLSARAISTIHARNLQGRPAQQQAGAAQPEAGEGDGLKGLARKLTQRSKRGGDLRGDSGKPADGRWEMKQLLAAADGDHTTRELGSGTAAAMGALQLVLADMAVDLEAIDTNSRLGNEDWRRYLAGDRAVFARRLAGAIDERTVNRITSLYRDDQRFHAAAEAYLSEFESLLTRAREGDGGGLLASSILSADTGKIYLAIAYALGRL
ncbi:MAG TPA: hypothetical protein VGI89_10745 [Rhizomicrobium sp.]